jgi:hypothetical protein
MEKWGIKENRIVTKPQSSDCPCQGAPARWCGNGTGSCQWYLPLGRGFAARSLSDFRCGAIAPAKVPDFLIRSCVIGICRLEVWEDVLGRFQATALEQ